MINLSMKVDTSGAVLKMARYGKFMNEAKQEELYNMGVDTERLAKYYAPKATGDMANSIRADFSELSRGVVTVSADVPYSKYQEFGYTPHDIYGFMYHSPSGVGVEPMFGRFRVSKFTPFMGPALEEIANNLDSYIFAIVNKAYQRSR